MGGSVLEKSCLNWLKPISNFFKVRKVSSLKNTCTGVPFLVKLQHSSLQLYWKTISFIVISQWLCLDFRNTFLKEPLLMAVCKSSEVNISSLWLIRCTQNFKELTWVFLNSRLHSVAATERRTIVCWEIAFSKKWYRIETSQYKCKSIDRFLYDTNSFFVSWLFVNSKILLGRRHP